MRIAAFVISNERKKSFLIPHRNALLFEDRSDKGSSFDGSAWFKRAQNLWTR